jgi:hypothetical protein
MGIKIQNKVYRLKKAALVAKDMPLPAGQELEIVIDVVYVNGNIVPPSFQDLFYNWIVNNPHLFEVITRKW